MKKISFNTILIEEPEGPDKGLPDGILFSVKLKSILEGFVTTYSVPSYYSFDKPCLFEGCCGFSTFSTIPSFKQKHDCTWDGFGRDYFQSRSYHYEASPFKLYSVDELRQQIEDWTETYALPCVSEDDPYSAFAEPLTFDGFLSEDWCAELHDYMELYVGKPTKHENLWTADGHPYRPFNAKQFYLHQLAQQILSGYSPHVSAAKRPRCRSLLMASCRQLSGDDLLGH